MADQPRIRDPKRATARPRLVWGGIGSAIVGVCVTGAGMMAGIAWLAWTSAGVILVGLLIAWRGGVMNDTRGQEPPHHELEELLEGGSHRGITPAAHVVGTVPEARAAAVTQRKQEILAGASATSPGLRRFGAYGLIPVGAWLFLNHWFIEYPLTVPGNDVGLRDVGFAIVLVLSGLRLRLSPRSLIASSLCLLCGILLVLSGLLLHDGSTALQLSDVVTGLLVLGLTSLTFSRA